MAVRIEETDFGTKNATKKKCDQIIRENPAKFKAMMNRYWYRVYENSVSAITDMGAVDTGALRDSIRIIDGATVGTGVSRGKYEVGRTDPEYSSVIVAGGGGYINDRKKTEVDYAQAVHDGSFKTAAIKKIYRKTNKQRKSQGQTKLTPQQFGASGGGWVPGRPFLDEGVKRTEAYFEQLLDQFLNDILNNWAKDQPLISPYSMPLMRYKSKYGG